SHRGGRRGVDQRGAPTGARKFPAGALRAARRRALGRGLFTIFTSGDAMKSIAATATLLVLVRFVIATLHGRAHEELHGDFSTWQNAFVYSVIVVAPLVAVVLYWTPWRAAGALLLGVSMLAGCLFGIYYHFIAISPDNVGHLPAGDAQGFFKATAVALIPA